MKTLSFLTTATLMALCVNSHAAQTTLVNQTDKDLNVWVTKEFNVPLPKGQHLEINSDDQQYKDGFELLAPDNQFLLSQRDGFGKVSTMQFPHNSGFGAYKIEVLDQDSEQTGETFTITGQDDKPVYSGICHEDPQITGLIECSGGQNLRVVFTNGKPSSVMLNKTIISPF